MKAPQIKSIINLLLLTSALSLKAANGSWTGATDATWAGANWSATPVPGTGNNATFNGAGGGHTTIDLGVGGVTILNLLLDTGSAAAYTIGSGGAGSQTLTLNDSGAITVNSTVANNQLFNAQLTLGTATASTYTLTDNSAANSLTFAGNIQGGTGGTAAAKTLRVCLKKNVGVSGSMVVKNKRRKCLNSLGGF